MGKRSFGIVSLIVAAVFVLSACADPQQPTATPVEFNPTVAGGATTPTTAAGETPQPTATPFVPTADAGQTIFNTNCATCHNTTSETLVGPGLAGVHDRGGSRIDGVSADDYIRQSILDPGSFIVDGFAPIMPAFPQLSGNDVENLLAYLTTLQ